MNRKSCAGLIFCALGMAVLILDTKTAILGGKEGIYICMNNLIPSLFPFIFLSTILTSLLLNFTCRPLRPIGKLTRIQPGTESLLIIGLLGGYPVGAQCINQAYIQGNLSKNDASRMLAFCNNCGPAFIFGFISRYFDDYKVPFLLWGIHILSAILVAVSIPGENSSSCSHGYTSMTVTQALMRTVLIMAQVCGWIILFRVIITFFDTWFGFYLPGSAKALLYGLLELANGCMTLDLIDHAGARFIICNVLISLGGMCVTMQTLGLLHKNINKQLYLPGKLMQCAYSTLISTMFCFTRGYSGWMLILLLICTLLILGFYVFFRIKKNNSSILSPAAI